MLLLDVGTGVGSACASADGYAAVHSNHFGKNVKDGLRYVLKDCLDKSGRIHTFGTVLS